MDVYDRMRREMEKQLQDNGMDYDKVLNILDSVSKHYSVINKDAGTIDIDTILEDYLSCCAYEQMSPGTIQNYRLAVGAMLRDLGIPLCSIRAADLRGYIKSYQAEHGIADVTANKYREYFNAFFSWCVNEGYCDNNPARGLKPIRCEKKMIDYYTQRDLELIRSACADERDRALVEVLYSTGCRVSELCTLQKSDIDWNSSTVRLYGKGKKHRVSYLNAKAAIYLQKYLETRTDDEPFLFLSYRGSHSLSRAGVERILRKIKERADKRLDKKITPHRFRHTMAATALQNGMPVEDIQAILGHENIDTTMVYASTCDDNVRMNHKKFVI